MGLTQELCNILVPLVSIHYQQCSAFSYGLVRNLFRMSFKANVTNLPQNSGTEGMTGSYFH